jgi:endonuclease/exonuclease/phosphatase family metal-dependent hydrolase
MKMKTIKKLLIVLMIVIAIPIALFGVLLFYAVVTDYKPDEKELIAQPENPSILKDSGTISLLTWNIGYGGLDRDMDFFYDGGIKVITPEDVCLENILAIGNFLKQNDTVDFILLQEVDRGSKRSYGTDQYEEFKGLLQDHYSFFAKNYDVFYVPTPPSEPMGKVYSGIATYSSFIPHSSTRYSLPGDMGFPTNLFYLDRCFMVNRYTIENGKELVLINTHNEAFDEGGLIRKAQMEKLREFVVSEFNNGNYVIVGGDWNQNPPDFNPEFSVNKSFTGQIGNFFLNSIDPDFMPAGWKWIFDTSSPTFRTLMAAYDPLTTPTSSCDIFLISPNIEIVYAKCLNLGFANSDHNPVITRVRLK